MPDFDVPLETYLHHINRYRFADNMLPYNISVLDVGCGTGYGVHILEGNGCRRVTGVDKNKDDIEYARNRYCHDCRVADVTDVELGCYDAITMFEVIEHLSMEEGVKLLKNVCGSCNYIMLSTPKDAEVGVNEHHKSQWDLESLEGCLTDFKVSLFGQDWSSGQVVFPFSKQVSMFVLFCVKKRYDLNG